MRHLIVLTLLLAGLAALPGCAIYKDKDGATHVEALPPPPAVYVAPPPAVYAPPPVGPSVEVAVPPPAYYYPAPAYPYYYGGYYAYPRGYSRWR